MKRIILTIALCLLLPAAGLCVTEGVVEAAPPVAIDLPHAGDALFGAWEQGLSDIRLAARHAAMAWADFPEDMKLEFLRMNNFPADTDVSNDEIMVRFRYGDETDGEKTLHVRYLRGTGELVWLSDTRVDIQRHSGEPLEESALMKIAVDRLANRYDAQEIILREGDDGEDAQRWLACFDSDQGMYEVFLDRQTGDVIRVSLEVDREQ